MTLKRNEEKEFAALTKFNTRKNKGGALPALQVLAKKALEKEDPSKRMQYLKEMHDETSQKEKIVQNKKGNNVAWAVELARYQGADGREIAMEKRDGVGVEEKVEDKQSVAVEKVKVKKEVKPAAPPTEEKKPRKTPVRVGVRSKIALGMATNGTPAPKRRMRGKA